MIYFQLSFLSLLIIAIHGNESANKQQENNVTANSREGRTLVPLPRTPALTLRHRQPSIKIRTRVDRPPVRNHLRRVHNNLPNGQLSQQQNIRFGYESLKSSKYMPSASKISNLSFSNNGKGAPHRSPPLAGHPNAIHVPSLSQQYIHNFKASPAFNGQVVVHPAPQTQNSQPAAGAGAGAQQENSYTKYLKTHQQPPTVAHSSQTHTQTQQKQHPTLIKYPDFQQYPIPDHEKMQQRNEQHEKYMQQQKFLTPKNPIAYYQQQQHQELQTQQQPQSQQNYAVQQTHQYLQQKQQQQQQQQQQQPSIPIYESAQTSNQNIAFPAAPAVPSKMYSVYEENDMTELQSNNYQTAANQALDKEAQEYLRFMNSDEYFLPKKEPNYKTIDDESDKRHYNAIKLQTQQHLQTIQQSPQAPTPYHQSLSQPTAYQPHIYPPSASSQNTQYTNKLSSNSYDAREHTQGNHISRLFYKQDPLTAVSASASASASDASTAAAASSTVVRTSYQTGYNQNQLYVNSQDNKIGKYTISPTATPNTVLYPQLRHNTAGNRTPEPLRFEFTERDAMVGSMSYTNAPQGQLRYKAITSNNIKPFITNEESSTASLVKSQSNRNSKYTIKPVVEEEQSEDDPEDGDDMQEAGTNFFGRQPLTDSDSKTNKVSSTTEAPNEQKDTEEYCERICAIVEDEDKEIVCGSDGYMYTSEAQMECYASCLHIDITIQGKGSCSTR